MESPLNKECAVCMDENKEKLYKICNCKRCLICNDCVTRLAEEKVSKCPTCRKYLTLDKKYHHWINFVNIIKKYWKVLIHLFVSLITTFCYLENKYYQDEDILYELENNDKTLLHNIIVKPKPLKIIVTLGDIVFFPLGLLAFNYIKYHSDVNDGNKLFKFEGSVSKYLLIFTNLFKFIFIISTCGFDPNIFSLYIYLSIIGFGQISIFIFPMFIKCLVIMGEHLNNFRNTQIKFDTTYNIIDIHHNRLTNQNMELNELNMYDVRENTENTTLEEDNFDNFGNESFVNSDITTEYVRNTRF